MAKTSNVPPVHDIEIYRGDDFIMGFQIQDDDGVAIPQDGVTSMTGQIRDSASSQGTLLASFNCDYVDASTEGKFAISLTPIQTSDLPLSGGFYDVQIVQDGLTKTKLRGSVSVVDQVTP